MSGNPGRGLPIIAWFLGSHGITDTKTRSTLDTVTLTATATEHRTHQQINTSFVIMRSFLLARSIVAVLKVFDELDLILKL